MSNWASPGWPLQTWWTGNLRGFHTKRLSGDPQPSREDRALTTRLYQAGKLLGIQVLDHIIVGEEGKYFSLANEG